MFRNEEENDEEYVAESYNFDEEETVLVSTCELRTLIFVQLRSLCVVRNFECSTLNVQLSILEHFENFALQKQTYRSGIGLSQTFSKLVRARRTSL